MKKRKHNRTSKSRLAIFALALILPICSSGLAYSVAPLSASAATTASYSTGLIEEVSVSNNNFSSSSSSYSLTTSLTGWTGQVSSGSGTTAGTISTGSTFNSYMSSTFYLSSNPGTASTDNYVLMINSTSSTTDERFETRQGYKSSSITLDANSYYSFQVSFKSDSAYSSDTSYVEKGTTDDEATISTSNFEAKGFSDTDEVYVATSINSNTYYVLKALEDSQSAISATSASGLDILYDDGTYYGVEYYDSYLFVVINDVTTNSNDITVNNNTNLYSLSANTSSTSTTNSDLSSLSVFYVDSNYVGVEIDGSYYLVSANDVTISNSTASISSDVTLYACSFTQSGTFTATYAQDLTVYYSTDNDETYIGVEYETGKYGFVKIEDTTDPSNADGMVDVKVGATIYVCENIEYNGTNYTVESGVTYFTTSTEYTALTKNANGSIYLSGLVDENDEDVSISFENVSSDEWVTFYFYVATGDTEQTVSLELWLASKTTKNSGVVFFDNVHVYQYSENMFWKDYQNNFGKSYSQTYYLNDSEDETITTEQVKFLDLREEEDVIAKIDFEDAASYSSTDTYFSKYWTKTASGAKIFNTSSASYFKSATGFDYVGSNLAAYETITDSGVSYVENKYFMALWANDSTVKVTYGESFEIKSNEIIKVTVSYKFSGLDSGSAYLYVTEGEDVLTTYNLSKYTVTEETANSGVSENGSSEYNNEYGTMEIYIKGSALYNSTFTISLGLGDDSTSATGCVIFDDITIKKATTEEYSDSSDIVEFGASSASPSVTNGNFNTVTVTDEMPYSPDDWTIENDEDATTFAGVINADSNRYDAYHDLYLEYEEDDATSGINNPYLWAKIANPGNPNTTNSEVTPNNILMVYNASSTYQTITSPTMTLSANTSYSLTFNYKTIRETSDTAFSVTAYLASDDGSDIKLFEKTGIFTESKWNEMTIYFQNGYGSAEVYLVIDFGTEKSGVKGYAFFDNFALTEEDDVPTTGNVIDMTDFFLNIPTNSVSDDENDYFIDSTAYSYTVSTGSSDSMMGGLVSSELFTSSEQEDLKAFAIDSSDTTMFLLQVSGQGSCYIKSNFGIDLTADTYYSLSFKVKTVFGQYRDEDTEYSYGLTAGLTGFDYMTDIHTDDVDDDGNVNEDYVTYTIYFCPTEDTTANLYFCLICDAPETHGMVVIYDIQFVSSDDDDSLETAYTNAESAMDEKGYDLNSNCVMVAYEDGTDTEDTDSDSTDSDDETTSETSYEWMMYLSTIVFGVAIIIAVVGYALRHVRIKKFKKKEKIDYAREHTVDMEEIRQKARAQRDEEVAKVQETLDKFQKELDRLEAEHKENVVKLRENDNVKLTKVTDKEFKEFGQKRTVISEKIDSLKKQIEDMKTPEYLLTIERKVYDVEEAKRKELLKVKKEIGIEEAPASDATEQKTSKKKKTTTKEAAENSTKSQSKTSTKKSSTEKSEKTESKTTKSKKDKKDE